MAENITTVKNYAQHSDWLPRLLDGADNLIRGALVRTIKTMPDGKIKDDWLNTTLDGADHFVKSIASKEN